MPRKSITILLLLAVFAGQILGGKSCCCSSTLLRQLANDAVSLLGATSLVDLKVAADRSVRPRCPHCVPEATILPFQSPPLDGLALCLPSGCRCVDHAMIATSDRAGAVEKQSEQGVESPLDFAANRLGRQPFKGSKSLTFYEIKPVFLDPSWQILACIWRL